METNTAMILRGIAPMPRHSTRRWKTRLSRSFTIGTKREFRGPGVARIRESMVLLTPAFSANRTVRQYTEEHYLPAAAAYAAHAAKNGKAGAGLFAWHSEIARRWSDVRFGTLQVTTQDGEMTFEVEVYLGGLDPSAVRVEVYADSRNGGASFRQEMPQKEPYSGDSAAEVYSVRMPATRPAADLPPRVIPFHPMAVPLEVNRILWQR